MPPRRVGLGGNRPVLIGVVVVLAMIAGVFAVVNLRADATGAASPEGAVEEFFDAVSDEDLIGVLEMLDPAERDVMVPFVRDLESELRRLGITEPVDLDDVPGFDLEVEGLEVSSQELAPGLAEVTVEDGRIRARTEPEAVPIGEVLRDLIEANDGEAEVGYAEDTADLDEGGPVFLIATETDGRWHLSMFFTVAEYARRDGDYELPDMAGGVEPRGAASPEDAVREFADAAAALDLEGMIALLPPDEMRALQVYAPLFLDEAQEDIEDAQADEDFSFSVDGLEFETSAVDGGTRVVPTAGTVTMDTEDGSMTFDLADGCVELSGELGEDFEDEFGDTRACMDELGDLADEELSDEEEADLRELGALFEDLEPGVVVVERDGGWYVDPLRTLDDLWFQALAGIERSDLEEGGILYRLFTGDVFAFDDYDEDDYDEDDFGEDDFGEDCPEWEDPEDC